MKNKAFTLLELMIVVAIIIVLALISIPYGKSYLAKAKRAEAYALLGSLATAEKAYWAEHGTYTNKLAGADSLGWSVASKKGGSKGGIYSVGFPGTAGVNYIAGSGDSGTGLSNGRADKNGFVAVAVADIDGDGQPDVLTVDETGEITIIQDDLKD